MSFCYDVGAPLQFAAHLPAYVYHVSVGRYRPLKLPLSCQIGPKRWFLDPRFIGGGDTPDIGHVFSKYTYFRPCGQIWLSSVQRPQRLGGEKKKESPVKYKSADILCRAA